MVESPGKFGARGPDRLNKVLNKDVQTVRDCGEGNSGEDTKERELEEIQYVSLQKVEELFFFFGKEKKKRSRRIFENWVWVKMELES